MGVFLDQNEDKPLLFRGAAHKGCSLEWLIDRHGAFQAMERAVVNATQTVHLTGWLFLVETPLLDKDVAKQVKGGQTWLDLIRHVVTKEKPAKVRIMPSDFDPFFYTPNHRLCWSTMRALSKLADELSPAAADRLQFFPTQQDARSDILASKMLKTLIDTFAGPKVATSRTETLLEQQIIGSVDDYNARAKKSFKAAVELYRQTPGHWSSISVETKAKRFVLRTKTRNTVNVGSHHQKSLVVDNQMAFCGGMDLTYLALNDRKHKLRRQHRNRRRFDILWHDVHCRLTGPAVSDLQRNFVSRWGAERLTFLQRMRDDLSLHAPKGGLVGLYFPKIRDAPAPITSQTGPFSVQVHRTLSTDGGPSATIATQRKDILEGYEKAISEANEYIYIENQYLRSRDLVQALIDRKSKNGRLQVIVVIPTAPEELVDPSTKDPLILMPIALQNEMIDDLNAAFGKSIGFFSLVAPIRSKKKALADEAGSPQIYVHSKLLIVDDVVCSVGSANANGRSFFLDTEINLAWEHPHTRQLRIDLWQEFLGTKPAEIAKWTPSTFLINWRRIAETNKRVPPKARKGFIVPHNHEKLKKIAKLLPLPANLEILLSIANPVEPAIARELVIENTDNRVEPLPEPNVS